MCTHFLSNKYFVTDASLIFLSPSRSFSRFPFSPVTFNPVSRSLKAHILLVFVTFVWGATFVVIKDALSLVTPLLFNAVRMVISAALLAVIFRREFARMTRGAVLSGIVIGTFLWAGYEFQTAGLQLTTPSKSAFLTGISVVLVPVLLALFWRRHVNRWTLMGVIAAFIGLYLMTVPAGGAGMSLDGINTGDLMTLGCAVMFAFQIIFVGRATQRFPYGQIVAVQLITCAVWMVISVPVLERSAHITWNVQVLWALGVTALLGTVVAFAVQGWAQQFTPPTHTALIFSLEPVFAGVTSYVVLGERLGWRGGVGAILILAGVLVSELLGTVQHPESELAEEAR